jgi:3-oxoacyl-[acyl-carrier protein] reductase
VDRVDLGLKGKTCIVTGASRGLGRDIARILAEEGADVALIARRQQNLQQVADELTSLGVRAFSISADLRQADEVQAAIATAISKLGRVDILINNVSTTTTGNLEMISDDQWFQSWSLKPMSYVRAIRAVLPQMRAQKGGRIVNVVGVAGTWAIGEYANSANNATMLHITKSLADYVGPDGISVFAVNPGAIEGTQKYDKDFGAWAKMAGKSIEEFRKSYTDNIPLRRYGTAEEIARLTVIMSSDLAQYAHGTALTIDGGVSRGVF